MLSNQQNVLSNPTQCWTDPFESAGLKVARRTTGIPNLFRMQGESKARPGNLTRHPTDLHKYIYCQSWSFLDESDAMWRIYSLNPENTEHAEHKPAIRISSTAEQLYEDCKANNPTSCTYFGRVRYLDQEELQSKILENPLGGPYLPRVENEYLEKVADSLLLKRIAFTHEAEARLILIKRLKEQKPKGEPTEKHHSYRSDITSWASSIILDPRLSDDTANYQRNLLVELGYKGPISQSALYGKPILLKVTKHNDTP